MRRNISITHERVAELFERMTANKENVSKFIEQCVLEHIDFKAHDYITRQEVMELLANYVPQDTKLVEKVSRSDVQKVLDL